MLNETTKKAKAKKAKVKKLTPIQKLKVERAEANQRAANIQGQLDYSKKEHASVVQRLQRDVENYSAALITQQTHGSKLQQEINTLQQEKRNLNEKLESAQRDVRRLAEEAGKFEGAMAIAREVVSAFKATNG